MAELEDIAFWPPSDSGRYRRVEGVEQRLVYCTCRRVAIMSVVIITLFIIGVAVPAGMLQAYKTNHPDHELPPPSLPLVAPSAPLETTTVGSSQPLQPAAKWRQWRLPTSVKPISYNLTIEPLLEEPFIYNGKVVVTIARNSNSDLVVMNSLDLNISSIIYTSSKSLVGTSCTYILSREFEQVEIHLPSNDTSEFQLEIKYNASLAANLDGFYKSSYTRIGQNSSTTIGSTQFEATHARLAFPCFDEPSFKAKFALNIRRKADWISIFNVELNSTMRVDNSSFMDFYGWTPIMSSYLVAFVVCDFESTDFITVNQRIKVRVFTPPGMKDQANFSLTVAEKVIGYYEEFFNISYPLNKLDMVAIPDFSAGAMENWGLITYRSSDLLYREGSSSSHDKKRVAWVVAHELAHQWFGNYVTMSWWNDLWLNEGLAEFIGQLVGQLKLSDENSYDWQMEENFIKSRGEALLQDALHTSGPLSLNVSAVSTSNEIEAQFDDIAYKKGASIVRMLLNYVGRDAFRKGLANYLRNHAYSNSIARDLWTAVDEACDHPNQSLVSMMESWTSEAGFPLITVSVEAGLLKISQQRFLLCSDCSLPVTNSSATWVVPVNYTTFSADGNTKGSQRVVLLSTIAETFPIGSNMLALINPNAIGYYRVLYDLRDDEWKLFVSSVFINSGKAWFSEIDRANLLDDADSLFRADMLSPDRLLYLYDVIKDDDSPLSWAVVTRSLDTLSSMFSQDADGYSCVADYIFWLLEGSLGRMNLSLSYMDTLTFSQRQRDVTILKLALKVNHKATFKKMAALSNLMDVWRNGTDLSQIHVDLLLPVAMCSVISGGESVWNEAWRRYQTSSVPSERVQLQKALGSSEDSMLLLRYLQRSLDEKQVSMQDVVDVIRSVAGNRRGMSLVWDHLKSNWSVFFSRYGRGSFTLGDIVTYSTQHLTRYVDLQEMTDFFSSRDLGSAKRAYAQSRETVMANIKLAKNLPSLLAEMQKYHQS